MDVEKVYTEVCPHILEFCKGKCLFVRGRSLQKNSIMIDNPYNCPKLDLLGENMYLAVNPEIRNKFR